MKPLTRILYAMQELIAKIIVKLEPPQPFHSLPLPEHNFSCYGTSTYIDFTCDSNSSNPWQSVTYDGSAGTNTHNK